MRSPSPRRRRSPDRKRPFQRHLSSPRFKRRSHSLSPVMRKRPVPRRHSPSPQGRRRHSPSPPGNRHRSPSPRGRRRLSPSPRPRRKSSPGPRSGSPRKKSPVRRERSRSRSLSRDRFRTKPLRMDRPRNVPRLGFPSESESQSRDRDLKFRQDRSRSQGYPSSPQKVTSSRPSGSQEPDKDSLVSRGDFDPYRDNSGGRGDKDYRTLALPNPTPSAAVSAVPRSRERFDQTGMTINERFLSITGPQEPFSPPENITIGIERNIPGNDPAVIRREIYPAEVVVIRRKDEGSKTLCRRLEFLGPKEEYVERRTIKVNTSNDSRQKQQHPKYGGFDASDGRPMLSDRWTVDQKDEAQIEMFKKHNMTREELDSYLLNPPTSVSARHGDRDDRMIATKSVERSSRSTHSGRGVHVDRDERVVLDSKGEKSPDLYKAKSQDYKFTVNLDEKPRWDPDSTRFERDPNDLRHNLSKKRSSSANDKEDSFDARQKLLKKRESELKKREMELKKKSALLEKKEKSIVEKKPDLPDFSNRPGKDLPDFSSRPDKYQYEEWQNKPEMTPKGSYYYEHDNRDQQDPWFRGRGRGFRSRGRSFRGRTFNRGGFRGNFQGSYRGASRDRPSTTFPKTRRDSVGREWKHDKYEDMDEKDDREERPSSTTKN